MSRIWVSLVLAAALASPAFADPVNDVDYRVLNDTDGGKGIASDNSSEIIGTKATEGSAAASGGSSAFVDNSVFQKDSALSTTDLSGHISGNAVNMQGSKFEGINEINDHSFNEAHGVSQVSQNSGQNSLIQQSFTIESNLKVDHSSP